MISDDQSASGVGVIDTSSLWAAASRLYGEKGTFRHPSRVLYESGREYFLSLMHNIILYDELRTDFDIQELEEEWYRGPVTEIVKRLSGAVRINAMPSDVRDDTIMSAILPVFAEKMQKGSLQSGPHGAYDTFERFNLDMRSFLEAVSVAGAHDRACLAEMGITAEWGDREKSLTDIARHLSVTVRTIRYSAHSRHIQSNEGRPSAFCASPQRIELLRDYFDADYLANTQLGATGFADLFAKLNLPKLGYDFSGIISKPLSLTDLGLAIAHLPTDEAIDRVLQVRNTDEAREIRRIWAARLWGTGLHAVEGYSSSQSIENVTAGRDVNQIHLVIGVPAGEQPPTTAPQTVSLTEQLRAWLLNALTRN